MSDDKIITSVADGKIAALEQLYICTRKNVYAFIFFILVSCSKL